MQLNMSLEAIVRSRISLLFLISLIILMTVPPNLASAQDPVIRAVLFFSNDCSHCHEVMEEQLPPLAQKFGKQLDIVGVDVDHEVGLEMYQAMLAQFNVPDDRVGVPTLVVGSDVLVGKFEIPEKLPGIIEQGLVEGGIDWPVIPGLADALAAQPGSSSVQTSTTQTQFEQPISDETGPIFVQRFMMDSIANTIAVIVLIGMLASVIIVCYKFLSGADSRLFHWSRWAIPLLAILGMGVAFYL
jgi:thiol-disulfide isomerase/thioredoxin